VDAQAQLALPADIDASDPLLRGHLALLHRVAKLFVTLTPGSPEQARCAKLAADVARLINERIALLRARASESPRRRRIRHAIEVRPHRPRLYLRTLPAKAKHAPRLRARGPALAAARAPRSRASRTRGSRRCTVAASGDPDSAGGDEPPSTSPRSNRHRGGPPIARKALAGGVYSLASAVRASACSLAGGRS
jgi:hypothetical protein